MSANPEGSKVIEIKKSGSLLGVLMFLVLIAIISVIAFSVYLKNEGYDFKSLNIKDAMEYLKKDKAADKEMYSEISIAQDGSVDCKLYKGYIIVLSKDSIKWYDKSNKLLQDKAMTLTQPVLRISDKYMAVIDIAGRDIFFYKDKNLLWTKKLDNQIINADINDDGYCTVVTRSKEYASIVQVIDENGADIYSKLYAQDIVLSAKTIHDGQDVLINKILTENIKAGTQLEFNNIYDEKPFASLNIADNVIPVIMSLGDNEVGTGKNIIVFIDKEGKEVWRKTIDSVFCVVPDSRKYVIAAGQFTNESGESKPLVVVYNNKGEEVYSFEQPDNIVGMDINGDRLLLRTHRSIYIYSIKGKKLGHYSSKNEIKDAYLVGDSDAIIISGSTISRVSVKKTN